MYLVPPPSRRESQAGSVYSEPVCRALLRIRASHAEEHRKLTPDESRELGEALRLLSIAALLEAQLSNMIAVPRAAD